MPDILPIDTVLENDQSEAMAVEGLENLEAGDRKARKHLLAEKPYEGSLISNNRLVSFFGNDLNGRMIQKFAAIQDRSTNKDGSETLKTDSGTFTILAEGVQPSSDQVGYGIRGAARKLYRAIAG
ncbi:MAG: hypothetical protein HOG89_02110 [Candidatus Peribacter sp.]|jgi:hypothetical protein|nr:hypothetical protein [Candidatus Peribacter sp.]MBT7337142.1 hypothetical protein [Candidatus Peregrinibacteria bacterium]MBT4392871.1 hypothetical protein [Candidatus Peribacter sp.]MBT4601355.1 hypothetical protein [Candidatus Peribacter sp.]MBT5149393.1 hypothetical protein [Candidatus Peribacter sp.]